MAGWHGLQLRARHLRRVDGSSVLLCAEARPFSPARLGEAAGGRGASAPSAALVHTARTDIHAASAPFSSILILFSLACGTARRRFLAHTARHGTCRRRKRQFHPLPFHPALAPRLNVLLKMEPMAISGGRRQRSVDAYWNGYTTRVAPGPPSVHGRVCQCALQEIRWWCGG